MGLMISKYLVCVCLSPFHLSGVLPFYFASKKLLQLDGKRKAQGARTSQKVSFRVKIGNMNEESKMVSLTKNILISNSLLILLFSQSKNDCEQRNWESFLQSPETPQRITLFNDSLTFKMFRKISQDKKQKERILHPDNGKRSGVNSKTEYFQLIQPSFLGVFLFSKDQQNSHLNQTQDMFIYIQKISMKVVFLIAIIVAVSAISLHAEESTQPVDKPVVLDCYAIRLGLPVSFSSLIVAWETRIPRLDAEGQSWIAAKNDGDQWIQVSGIDKKEWIGVVTQGRGAWSQWIKSYKVLISNDGVYWDEVDDGRIFKGNEDENTHVKHWFRAPVSARSIRIVPKSWSYHISARVDFIYKC